MDAFPDWATPGEERKKYGKAACAGGLPINKLILSDKDATEGFLEQKGKFYIIS